MKRKRPTIPAQKASGLKRFPMKALSLRKALDLMRQENHRLIVMSNPLSPNGRSFYVVPGGYVEPGDAQKILERPDIQPFDDGLFPGCPQSWKLGRAT